MESYRTNGVVGAILDEYEKALTELDSVIAGLSQEDLLATVDSNTKDQDCKSIQTILTHVVRAGYAYVIEIRKSLGEPIDFIPKEHFNSVELYQQELWKMFKYNEQLFKDHPNLKLEENNPKNKILVRWGQLYDIEQLFEHAIVHILRHRRQIERFILILQKR